MGYETGGAGRTDWVRCNPQPEGLLLEGQGGRIRFGMISSRWDMKLEGRGGRVRSGIISSRWGMTLEGQGVAGRRGMTLDGPI